MAGLLASLIAESTPCPAATPATPATPRPNEALKVAESQESHGSACRKSGFWTERLLSALRAEGLPDAWLGKDHGDIELLEALSDRALTAYVLAMRDSQLHERGERLPDETAPALCRSCGPVWLAQPIARVVPVVDGWPRILGGACCHIRNRKAIPRPLVTCGGCLHFTRDHVNPAGGMGRCQLGVAGRTLPFPHAERECADWRPASSNFV